MKHFRKPVAWILAIPLVCTALVSFKGDDHNFLISKYLDIFHSVFRELDMMYVDTLDVATTIESGIHAMLSELDPYTIYYPEEDDDDLKMMLTGKYAGVGAIIRYHQKHNRVVIVEPYEGMPALDAGLRAGDILLSIDGEDINDTKYDRKLLRKKVGIVFQYPEYQLFEDTVAKDVAFGPKNMKLQKDEIDKRVRKSLELVGLPYDEFAERSPFELSGGEKRRVAIAGVIAMEPKILVLDEPFAGLDPEGVREITALILKLESEICPTIITVTHDMDSASTLADRIIALREGKIVADGTPKEVFADTDKIRSIGLDVPQTCVLAKMLKNDGINLKNDLLSIDELVENIDDLLKGQ